MWIPSQEECALLVVGSTVLKWISLSSALLIPPSRPGGRGHSGGVALENLRGLLSGEQLVKGPELL